MWGAIFFEIAPRDLPVQNRYNPRRQQASKKDDRASAGTVVPADANQGVLPILI
jgi:hypothetical protein